MMDLLWNGRAALDPVDPPTPTAAYPVAMLRQLRQALLDETMVPGAVVCSLLVWHKAQDAKSGAAVCVSAGASLRVDEYLNGTTVRATVLGQWHDQRELSMVVDVSKLKVKDRREWSVEDAFEVALRRMPLQPPESWSGAGGGGGGSGGGGGGSGGETYVVHAWSVRFCGLVEAIASAFAPDEWVVLAALNGATAMMGNDIRAVATDMWRFERVTLYVESWKALEPLRHAWPALELVEASRAGLALSILVHPCEQRAVVEQVRADYEGTLFRVGHLDPEALQCRTSATARALILAELEKLGGHELDDFRRVMREAASDLVVRLAVAKPSANKLLLTDVSAAAAGPVEPAERAHRLNDAGSLLALLNDNHEALAKFAEAHRIFRELREPAGLVEVLLNQSHSHMRLGNADAALKLMREARVHAKYVGNAVDPLHVARVENELGGLHFELCNYAAAQTSLQYAYEVYKEHRHPFLGAVSSNIGNVLYEQSDFRGAKRCYVEALHLQEAYFGTRKHPNVLNTLQGLALVMIEEGQFRKAKTLVDEGLAAEEELFGREHPRALRTRQVLASILYRQGDYDEAIEQCRKCEAALANAQGADSMLAQSLLLIGTCLGEREDFDEADKCLDAALTAQLRASGPGHINVARIFNNIAFVRRRQGRFTEALEALTQARKSMESCMVSKPTINASLVLFNMAAVHAGRGDLDLAFVCARQCLDLQHKLLGRSHPALVQTFNLLGLVSMRQGELQSAEEALQEALDLGQRTIGARHLHVVETYHRLASLRGLQGRKTEASSFFRAALETAKRVLKPGSQSLTEIVHDFVQLFSAEVEDGLVAPPRDSCVPGDLEVSDTDEHDDELGDDELGDDELGGGDVDGGGSDDDTVSSLGDDSILSSHASLGALANPLTRGSRSKPALRPCAKPSAGPARPSNLSS